MPVHFSLFLCAIYATPAFAENHALRTVRQAIRALDSRRDLDHLEILHIHHAADHVLRLLTEWVVRLIFLQVGFQRVSIWMRRKLSN